MSLLGLASVGTAVLGMGMTGCSRLGSGLYGGHLFGASLFDPNASAAVNPNSEAQLTSSVMTRLNFEATADIPIEQLLAAGDRPLPMNGLCPPDMASVDDKFCVDTFEASLVEVMPDGRELPWPYFQAPDALGAGHTVRAVSEKGVYPQGYISEKQAVDACGRSGKRLCRAAEWKTACRGPEAKKFGYANERTPGTCNDNGKSPVPSFFPVAFVEGKAFTWEKMNDVRLNQMAGGLAETGSHEECTNGYGVYDMVGNLHEWVLDPAGSFQGGYYLDVTQNGDGCGYRTEAHEAWYHDYSTGFRCCSDPAQ